MKSKWLIEKRLEDETDGEVIKTLLWILESPECPMCNHPQLRDLETKIHRNEVTPSFLETRFRWPIGIVDEHMKDHVEYDPIEGQIIEQMREESINTLNVAEDLVQRLVSWVDELERQKELDGISSDWVADATKLLGQGQGFLKLVGQLKKEIGVDSQLLLADRKVDGVMRVLVDVLRNEPNYLDQIELQMAALKQPSHTVDADFEVLE